MLLRLTHTEGGRGGILWDSKRFEGRCGQNGVTSGLDLGDELKLFRLTDVHIHGYLLLCPPPLTLHGLFSDRSCEFGRRRAEGGGREKRGKKKEEGKENEGGRERGEQGGRKRNIGARREEGRETLGQEGRKGRREAEKMEHKEEG